MSLVAKTKSQLLSPLKYVWRNLGVRQHVLNRRFDHWLQQWQEACSCCENDFACQAENVLIIPSDPELLTSSSGDQAMIGAIIRYWQQTRQNSRFFAATASETADAEATQRQIAPLPLLRPDASFAAALAAVRKHQIGTVVLMGADVLDGSYNVAFSGRQLMLADLLARLGCNCFVTGFSVSKNFQPRIRQFFDQIDPSIEINLRDPVSFQRFKEATKAKAKLVADIAFLLPPKGSDQTREVVTWIEGQKAAAHSVIGINAHPLLLELTERNRVPEFIDRLCQILKQLAGQRDVSFLMIDHDKRGDSSDCLCLQPIQQQLEPTLGDRLYYPPFRLAADEVKEVAKHLDGIVSGRMHLMIASLGAGTPVFGIDYKDKMEGLLNHFSMSTEDLTSAAEILSAPQLVADRLFQFVDALQTKREQVVALKPKITQAAEANFLKESANAR